MCSWPTRMFACLGPEGENLNELLQEFKRDWDLWNKLKGLDMRGKVLSEIERRHCMRKVSNEQIAVAGKLAGWQVLGEGSLLESIIKSRSMVIGGSHLAEELIGSMKNTKKTSNHTLFRRPEVSMHSALKAQTIDKRHRYDAIVCDRPLPSKGLRLPVSAFRPDPKSRSYPFQKIASTKASPDWFSPSVAKLCCPAADLQLLRDSADNGDLHVAEGAWQGAMVASKHMVLVRQRRVGNDEVDGRPDLSGEWFFGLLHFHSSCAAGWPCRLERVPGCERTHHVVFDASARRPALLSVFDHRGWEACVVTPRSWAWQWQNFPGMRGKGSALRLFLKQGPDSLLRIAASQAFWSLPRSWLSTLASHEGWDTGIGDSEFNMLFGCVQNALACSDDEALATVSKRLGANDLDSSFAAAVMEIDAAIDVLDRNDHQKVSSKQKDVAQHESARKAFVDDFGEKKREVVAKLGGDGRRGKTVNTVPLVFVRGVPLLAE